AWKTMTPLDLAHLLGDPRPAVRHRAIHTLSQKGKTAVPALAQVIATDRSVIARTNAVWTATRIDDPASRAAITGALLDPDETVRRAAAHAASLCRAAEASSALAQLLHNASPQNRRAAAEALGRIGNRSAVPEILKSLGELIGTDRVLEHSLTYALI